MTPPAKIMHLSDLHFHETDDGEEAHYKHSLSCMRRIEEVFKKEAPDILLVTGDLTNIGDPLNLDRVHQWIHDRINIKSQFYGLEADGSNCEIIIVPGNHDAFNAPSMGAQYKRWQSALSNYYKAFPNYTLENGIAYRWFEKGNINLFFCILDSTYLGDPETSHLPGLLNLDRVAKGRISREQSKQVLALYDEGIDGQLKRVDGTQISRKKFLSSFKILVLHHYLFEPGDAKATPLLHLKQKQTVFQNIAMADFDALLCGHKHVSEFRNLVYLDQFEPRGKIRYALNHVRRVLGIRSLPLTEAETEGRSVKKAWRFLLSVLYLNHVDEHGLTEVTANGIIDILEKGLRDRKVVKEEILSYLRKQRASRAASLFERDEVLELHHRIMNRFRGDDKTSLMALADSIKPVVTKLASRPFLHSIAGSACKASEVTARTRSFNIYDIRSDSDAGLIKFKSVRYSWNHNAAAPDNTSGIFMPGAATEISLPFDRVSWQTVDNVLSKPLPEITPST